MQAIFRLAQPLALLFAFVAGPADAHDHSFGTHGMVLFGGREALYASHLPLFRAPHDHQVVLQVRLADPALDRTLRERLDGKTALWTIEPERLALSSSACWSIASSTRARARARRRATCRWDAFS